MQLGSNDVLRSVPPAQTREQFDAILREFGRCGIPVLVMTLTPPAFLHARVAAYSSILTEAAARHGAAICAFLPADVLGHPDMVLYDGIHPNARAITAAVEMVLPAIEQMLAQGQRSGLESIV